MSKTVSNFYVCRLFCLLLSLLVISCYGDIFSAPSFHIFFHNIQPHALNIITSVCLPTSAESTTDGTTLQHRLVQIIEITKTQVLHKPTQSRTGRIPVSLVLRAYCNEDKQNLTHLVSLSTKDWHLKGWYYIYHKKKNIFDLRTGASDRITRDKRFTDRRLIWCSTLRVSNYHFWSFIQMPQ